MYGIPAAKQGLLALELARDGSPLPAYAESEFNVRPYRSS